MCTVTILRESRRVLVTMNRDERREREPELPPRVHHAASHGGRDWIGPVDGKGGGAWIGSDGERVACLLNRYEDPTRRGLASRGAVIPNLLSAAERVEIVPGVGQRLGAERHNPFTLLLVDAARGMRIDWNGSTVAEEPLADDRWAMASSSSWNANQVLPWREQEFHTWRQDEEFDGPLPSFHLHCPSSMEEWAPLMSRSYSVTRSITQVELDKSGAALRYWTDPRQRPPAAPILMRISQPGGAA